jgi:hypothetical protein
VLTVGFQQFFIRGRFAQPLVFSHEPTSGRRGATGVGAGHRDPGSPTLGGTTSPPMPERGVFGFRVTRQGVESNVVRVERSGAT